MFTAVVAAGGCSPDIGTSVNGPNMLDLEVEFSACDRVLKGPVCLLDDAREIKLWVRSAPDALVDIRGDGEVTVQRLADNLQGGQLFIVVVDEATREVIVKASRGAARREWRLDVDEERHTAWLSEAREAYLQGNYEIAETLIDSELRGASTADSSAAHGLLGRIARRQNKTPEAQEHLTQAIDTGRKSGRQSDLVHDITALSYTLIRGDNRFAEAKLLLDSLPDGSGLSGESRYFVHYYRGLYAQYSGNPRKAIRELEDAAATAERLRSPEKQILVDELLAVQLQRIGRRTEASERFAHWKTLPNNYSPCDQARFLNNYGFSQLLLMEAGEPSKDAVPLLKEAHAIYSTVCSNDNYAIANVLTNLALAHTQLGNEDAATKYLAQAVQNTEVSQLRLVLWQKDISARIAILQNNPKEALRLSNEFAQAAEATLSTGGQWRAQVSTAMAYAKLGNKAAAISAFETAEAQVVTDSLSVPVHEGLDGFLARRQSVSRLHLELLLDEGRESDGYALARRLRTATIRVLDYQSKLAQLSAAEKDVLQRKLEAFRNRRDTLQDSRATDWTLTQDEKRRVEPVRHEETRELNRMLDNALSTLNENKPGNVEYKAPRPGELVLLYHPLSQGWVGFAENEAGLQVHRLDCFDSESTRSELSQCLLGAFRQEVDRASSLRVLATDALRFVDFHALPFDGAALIDHLPVSYSLDIAARSDYRQNSIAQSKRHGLVVADARGDLPEARKEAGVIAALLTERAWTLDVVKGHDANAKSVLQKLANADLFHYAGHAVFHGDRGWESVLKLADRSNLTIADILALFSAPPMVVLSGCETGRAASGTAESVGIAQAFLVRGSTEVLAAVRPVQDQLAGEMVREFYLAWLPGEPPAVALQRAQIRVRNSFPDEDWASFRLIER